jgi:hypothetical protein
MAKKEIRQIRVEGNVAYVPLTQGYEAVIDAADVLLVAGFNWLTRTAPYTAYAARNGREVLGERKGKVVFLHQAIFPPKDGFVIDHIDGDGLNNRRENLRYATKAENGRNSRKKKNNTSGFKGVYLHRQSGRWQARISTGKPTQRSLGMFSTPEEAHEAYVKASAEMHGEFGRAY